MDNMNKGIKVPQKRPRPVLSCLECKKKKLKCDRQSPCLQCVKSGRSSQCSYSETSSSTGPSQQAPCAAEATCVGRPAKLARVMPVEGIHVQVADISMVSNHASSPVVKVGVIEDLQNRVQRLEEQLAVQSRGLSPPRNHTDQTRRLNVTSKGVVHLKGSSTRFHGQNQKAALLNHFHEARAFIKKVESKSEDPVTLTLHSELASLQRLLPKQSSVNEERPRGIALARMLQLLPSRTACDKLIVIYGDNFENELRVLHMPSFSDEVALFWNSPEPPSSGSSDLIPQLLCVLAIATSLDDADLLAYGTPNGRATVVLYCDLVASWLDDLKTKQRLRFSTLQTQTLLLMARQCSTENVKEMWNSTGSLVRSAMMIGLHRDPSEYPQISAFSAEMRRRLWMTIVEIDLQTSLTYGMPTMVCPTDFTCGLPANVDDIDLFVDMKDPAPSRSFAEWADSLPQALLAKSLRERLEAARLLSNIGEGLEYEKILQRAKSLERVLQDLPAPLKFDHHLNQDKKMPGRLLARVLLDLHIRRAILSLCSPFAQVDPDHANFVEARRIFIRSSLVILCFQDIFDPNFTDLDIVTTPKYWDFFHLCCKTDMMHASLGVCLEIKRLSRNPRSLDASQTANSHSPDGVSSNVSATATWSKTSLTKTVEDNIDPLMRRLGRFRSDAKDLLCLSIVLNSVKTNQSPERKEALMESGLKDLIKACQQHLQKVRSDSNHAEYANIDITPLSQAGTFQSNGSSDLDLSSLIGAEFDFAQMDFGLSEDWPSEQTWF